MKQSAYFCVGILLSTVAPLTFASPINAVIGLDNSQIVENSSQLSFQPNPGTLLPLQQNFPPITHLQNNLDSQWFDEIGQKVRVEHKQRDLSYTGMLTRIEQDKRTFLILIDERPTTLPLDDFYLIPLEKVDSTPSAKTDLQVSYQTNQLSWTPQLSLIFEGNNVSVSQQALLHNQSSETITLQDSLLHYARNAPNRLFKAERNALAMSADQSSMDYQDNEISYPLGNKAIQMAPYSNALIPLPSSTSKVEKQTHTASLYTHENSSGNIELNFYNNLSFSFKNDGLPGEYRTFQKRGNLLIPSNTVFLNTVRANYPINVVTNKSQDITGSLTLISASSQKLPASQTWQATIDNLSNQDQDYAIEQNINGIIEVLEGDEATKLTASSLIIKGKIKAHSKKTVTYKIELKN
ncbi:hypothetical protein [Marinomonas shanghaiensis]|uniref:hypothetical protein n=1 Tax=Marinomonas shanghaiensis TaxID=2202418 RepID=UPI000DBAA4D4|nr:hypothetical protein [Marinomonas shanghaiensis]